MTSTGKPGDPYRPSNGTEGECFMSDFCAVCKRGTSRREGDDEYGIPCEILGRTFGFNEDAPEYPKEMTYDKHGDPTCTAFEHKDDPAKPYRCPETPDLFGGAHG